MQGFTEPQLTAKQDKAILALLTEPTIAAAAKSIGVNEATLHRWLKLPHFQARYREARRQSVEVALAQLQQGCTVAALTLRSLCGQGIPGRRTVERGQEQLGAVGRGGEAAGLDLAT